MVCPICKMVILEFHTSITQCYFPLHHPGLYTQKFNIVLCSHLPLFHAHLLKTEDKVFSYALFYKSK